MQKVEEGDRQGLSAQQVGSVSVNPVTAWRMLRGFGGLKEGSGEWWVQNGANSGVGRAALQLGRRWGWRGIAVVRGREGEEGRELERELLALGAERVVREEEVLERGFKERMREWTGGEEVRLALNCVGGDAAVRMLGCLGRGATCVTYGAMSKKPMRVGAGMLIFGDLKFEGFWVSRWGDEFPEEKKTTIDAILELMRKGEFRDVPTVEVGWDWGTGREGLVDAVQGTLEGYRKGKGMFVFGDT